MSFGERDAFTSLLITLIVAAMFYFRITGQSAAGLYDGPDGLMIWARSVLWLIAISIGIAIGVTILFTILYTILTGEMKPSDLRDERDRMIEVRGMRIESLLVHFGLAAGIIYLAWGGASAVRALNVILIGLMLSGIVKEIFKIICYRRGF